MAASYKVRNQGTSSNLQFKKISLVILFLTVIGVSLVSLKDVAHGQALLLDFNFGAVGDWGCTQNSDSTVNNILSRDTELVLGLGDYSYATTADCWLSTVEPIDQKMRIAIGNHDDISSPILDQFMRYFGLNNQFYSFTYQNVHFLVMSTELPFTVGSEQYNFVKNDLVKSSRDLDIDWIVVYFHKLAYTSPTNHAAIPGLRDTYHPLFERFDVDLVLQGHNHNYQRSYPIRYNLASPPNPMVTDTRSNGYTDPSGQIFATVGTGGRSLYSFTGQAYYIFHQQSTSFGFLNVDVSNNGTNLAGKFYDNSGSILDEFTINKNYHYRPFLQLAGAQHQDIPSGSSLQLTEFTLATWFRTDKTHPGNAYIVNKGGVGSEVPGGNMNYGIIMSATGKILGGFETESGADYFARSPASYSDGKWHYASVTHDGTRVTLYIDGVRVASKSVDNALPDRSGIQPFRIGANSLTLNGYFVGYTDEVRLWNRAHSAQEIFDAYDNGVINVNGQIIYRSFYQ